MADYELSMSDYVTKAGNMLFLKPMLSEGHTENPFKQSTREYPVDFGYPIEETFIANFEIPQGYKLSEILPNLALALPDNSGKFTYMITNTDTQVSVTSRFIIKRTFFLPDQYVYLKEFFNKIVEKHSQQITLIKK